MNNRKRNRGFVPYVDLPRRRQRDAFIKLRWQILSDTLTYGGRFTSHQEFDKSSRLAPFNQWFDFLFLGSDGRTVWNAEIVTASRAFWDQANATAWDRATALMTEQELKEEFRYDSKRVVRGNQVFYELKAKKSYPRKCFSGRTFDEYLLGLRDEIVETAAPLIWECYEVNRHYRYGIGLHIVVDTEKIDRNIIEAAIERFYELGEIDWRASVPVSRLSRAL